MAILSPKQAEFIRLTVDAGWCGHVTPARHREAWRVRARDNGSNTREFAQTVGDALVSLGFLIPDTSARPETGDGVTIHAFVPTARAAEWVRKFPGK